MRSLVSERVHGAVDAFWVWGLGFKVEGYSVRAEGHGFGSLGLEV